MLRQRTVGPLLGGDGEVDGSSEPRFPHLSRLMTTLLVVPAGNASSEIVCSQCGRSPLISAMRSAQREVERRRLGNKLHVLGKVNSLCEVGNLSL